MMVVGKTVKLKGTDLVGKVDSIHLKADKTRNRPKDLFKVNWKNGKVGLIEEKDLKIFD